MHGSSIPKVVVSHEWETCTCILDAPNICIHVVYCLWSEMGEKYKDIYCTIHIWRSIDISKYGTSPSQAKNIWICYVAVELDNQKRNMVPLCPSRSVFELWAETSHAQQRLRIVQSDQNIRGHVSLLYPPNFSSSCEEHCNTPCLQRQSNIRYSLVDPRTKRRNNEAGGLVFTAPLVLFTEGVLTGVTTFQLALHSNDGC